MTDHDREWRVHQHHGRDGIWGQIISEAGRHPVDRAELDRLQRIVIVIGDARFIHLGLRQQGDLIGEHDRVTGARSA